MAASPPRAPGSSKPPPPPSRLPSAPPRARRYAERRPWPDAAATVAALAASGVRLAVVTNCSERLGRIAAARLGTPFDAVITAERAGFYKPDPAPYRIALDALRATPERT